MTAIHLKKGSLTISLSMQDRTQPTVPAHHQHPQAGHVRKKCQRRLRLLPWQLHDLQASALLVDKAAPGDQCCPEECCYVPSQLSW